MKIRNARRFLSPLYLFVMFVCWHLINRVMLAESADSVPTAGAEINPIYILSIIVTVLFALAAFLLGRELKQYDEKIQVLFKQNDEIEKGQNECCRKIARLQERCDERTRVGKYGP